MKNLVKIVVVVLALVMMLNSAVFAVSSDDETMNESSERVPQGRFGLVESSPEFYENLEEYELSEEEAPNLRNPFLPSSVDNSDSDYFPPIGDQKHTNSCATFATAYYQFTYEVNRYFDYSLYDHEDDPDYDINEHIYCPQFLYSLVQLGEDEGTSFEACYDVLHKLGCLKYSDYVSETIDTDDEFMTYVSDNTDARIEALNIRANITSRSVVADDAYVINPGDPLGEILVADRVIEFDEESEKYEAFDRVKTVLASGCVMTLSTYFNNPEYVMNSDGEWVITSVSRGIHTARHALAVVGYDDDFEVDANGDGVISDWEKGAFKIANSWGEDCNCHNDGFIWVLYDAFNKVSCCPDPTYNRTNRIGIGMIDSDKKIHFYAIGIHEKDVYLIGKVNFDSSLVRSLHFGYGVADQDEGSVEYSFEEQNCIPYFYGNDDQLFIHMMTPFNVTAEYVFDYADFYDPFSDNYTGLRWCLYYKTFKLRGDPIGNLNTFSIIDNFGNLIGTENVNQIITKYGDAVGVDVSLTIGDLNYDGVIDSDDLDILRSGITGDLSNVQEFLGDIDGDGDISSRDVRQLILLINDNI